MQPVSRSAEEQRPLPDALDHSSPPVLEWRRRVIRSLAMTTFTTSRQLSAGPAEVFAAISQPDRLARWWGPAEFTNTFDVFEFRPGGAWRFTMHGPNGRDYPNESVFAEIETDRKIVIDHVSPPRFRLVVELSPVDGGILVSWTQTFEDPSVAAAIRHIVEPANEQNLDRLAVEVGCDETTR